ncbi:hypothetical protein B0H13DRAFT_1972430 [Mycena leptocephala]|nr:hypothetical protein B0H13DRAFT_1972430 [Mycena leptocephala]
MDDELEKGRVERERANPVHEAAAAKLWAVYVSEAHKYDKGLVESWKADMEGMLIFAGLFSASVTAFLIESYKTLTPDAANTSATLLAQISLQISAAQSGSDFIVPDGTPFAPSAASLVCNTLWFISLGLSLTCALAATLLEQWARDFLHRTDIRSEPAARARVFSYLYYGMRRFNMHAVVEIIPLLLHASLLFFLGGLLAFLIPVNTIIMAINALLLAIVVIVYSLLTILPLFYSDCPYRTPLSGVLWRAIQASGAITRRGHNRSDAGAKGGHTSDITMANLVFRRAAEYSEKQSNRDSQALVWTVKSLTDDTKFETFIEAIPDVIWAAEARRYVHDAHILQLISHPDIMLVDRIVTFHRGSYGGVLTPEVSRRRRICSYKAVWALGSLSSLVTSSNQRFPSLTGTSSWICNELDSMGGNRNLNIRPDKDSDVLHYAASADAMCEWASFCAARLLLCTTLEQLTRCNSELGDRIPDMTALLTCFRELKSYGINLNFEELERHSQEPATQCLLIPVIRRLTDKTRALSGEVPFIILIWYLVKSAQLESLPYRFWHTVERVSVPEVLCSVQMMRLLNGALEAMVNGHMDRFNTEGSEDPSWLDEILRIIMSHWRPAETDGHTLPSALIHYINARNSHSAVVAAIVAVPLTTWTAIPASIRGRRPGRGGGGLEELLTALWTVFDCVNGILQDLTNLEEVLETISKADCPSVTPSLVALVKFTLLNTLVFPRHGFTPDTRLIRHEYAVQGQLHILTEFFESCLSSELPFKAAETVGVIGTLTPRSAIHPAEQMRFAKAIENMFNTCADRTEEPLMLYAVINISAFDVYSLGHESATGSTVRFQWLDDPEARQLVKETLQRYLHKLSTADRLPLARRVQLIIAQLDTLHFEGMPSQKQ